MYANILCFVISIQLEFIYFILYIYILDADALFVSYFTVYRDTDCSKYCPLPRQDNSAPIALPNLRVELDVIEGCAMEAYGC